MVAGESKQAFSRQQVLVSWVQLAMSSVPGSTVESWKGRWLIWGFGSQRLGRMLETPPCCSFGPRGKAPCELDEDLEEDQDEAQENRQNSAGKGVAPCCLGPLWAPGRSGRRLSAHPGSHRCRSGEGATRGAVRGLTKAMMSMRAEAGSREDGRGLVIGGESGGLAGCRTV